MNLKLSTIGNQKEKRTELFASIVNPSLSDGIAVILVGFVRNVKGALLFAQEQ